MWCIVCVSSTPVFVLDSLSDLSQLVASIRSHSLDSDRELKNITHTLHNSIHTIQQRKSNPVVVLALPVSSNSDAESKLSSPSDDAGKLDRWVKCLIDSREHVAFCFVLFRAFITMRLFDWLEIFHWLISRLPLLVILETIMQHVDYYFLFRTFIIQSYP